MVVRVAEQAARSGPSRLVVATDDVRVADAVRQHGFEAVMTRADHATGTDRLAEVVSLLKLDDNEIIVNVQGDEPLINPDFIRAVAALLQSRSNAAIATACHRISDSDEVFSPNVVKVALDQDNFALYFSRAPIPFARDGFSESKKIIPHDLPIFRHIGLYAYRAKFLKVFPKLAVPAMEKFEALEQLRALWHGYKIAVLITEATPAPGVDTPEDLARVRALFDQRS